MITAKGEPIKVNEAKRTIVFANGGSTEVTNVTEVDNRGTYLRLTCDQGYFLINPEHVLFHQIHDVNAKVF